MPRTIVLDNLKLREVLVMVRDGEVVVNAVYDVLSGQEVIRHVSRDVTPFLPNTTLATIDSQFDDWERRLRQLELGE